MCSMEAPGSWLPADPQSPPTSMQPGLGPQCCGEGMPIFVTGRYTPRGPRWSTPVVGLRAPETFAVLELVVRPELCSRSSCCSSSLGLFLSGSFVPTLSQKAVATQAVHSTLARGGLCHAGSALDPPVESTAIGTRSHDRPEPTPKGLLGSGSTSTPEFEGSILNVFCLCYSVSSLCARSLNIVLASCSMVAFFFMSLLALAIVFHTMAKLGWKSVASKIRPMTTSRLRILRVLPT